MIETKLLQVENNMNQIDCYQNVGIVDAHFGKKAQ